MKKVYPAAVAVQVDMHSQKLSAKKAPSQRAKLAPLIRQDGGRFDMLKEKTEEALQVILPPLIPPPAPASCCVRLCSSHMHLS